MKFVSGLMLLGVLSVVGCGESAATVPENPSTTAEKNPATDSAESPEKATPSEPKPEPEKLPDAPVPNKKIGAKSVINQPAPKFHVKQWLTKRPKMKGKMVIVDFWATWCGPCVESIRELNKFHREFPDRLAIIGVTYEEADVVRAHRGEKIMYAVATDPERTMYNKLGVSLIPHLIVIDPTGVVRWEGFPAQKRHELTVEVMRELLDTYVK